MLTCTLYTEWAVLIYFIENYLCQVICDMWLALFIRIFSFEFIVWSNWDLLSSSILDLGSIFFDYWGATAYNQGFCRVSPGWWNCFSLKWLCCKVLHKKILYGLILIVLVIKTNIVRNDFVWNQWFLEDGNLLLFWRFIHFLGTWERVWVIYWGKFRRR